MAAQGALSDLQQRRPSDRFAQFKGRNRGLGKSLVNRVSHYRLRIASPCSGYLRARPRLVGANGTNLQRWAAFERGKVMLPKLRQKSTGHIARRDEYQPVVKNNLNGNAVSSFGPNSPTLVGDDAAESDRRRA
jgi:hypothetical protein